MTYPHSLSLPAKEEKIGYWLTSRSLLDYIPPNWIWVENCRCNLLATRWFGYSHSLLLHWVQVYLRLISFIWMILPSNRHSKVRHELRFILGCLSKLGVATRTIRQLGHKNTSPAGSDKKYLILISYPGVV